ncbi:MAG TPA: LacI family DNA-binding transcriptional regulator [Naasia sp.]
MVGIEDVARVAGVSSATVSRALSGRGAVSDATRARVHGAARDLGYVVSSDASSLASGRSRAVGVIIPFLGSWFYGAVIEGAQSALIARGYDLTLYNLGGAGGERRSFFEQLLFRKRVDAMLAVSLEVTPAEVRRMHQMGRPIVCVGGPIPGLHTLSVDDVAASYAVTSHLTALGHRRIGHIAGGPGEYDFHLPRNRRVGYEKALREAGVAPDRSLVEAGDFTGRGGHDAALRLLTRPDRPTAIFAASDEMAIGAIVAARELGLRVPEDLSVVGFDDHEMAALFELTTIAQYPSDQGRQAVELIMAELEPRRSERDVEGNLTMPFDLVVRGSTAPPPPGGRA